MLPALKDACTAECTNQSGIIDVLNLHDTRITLPTVGSLRSKGQPPVSFLQLLEL